VERQDARAAREFQEPDEEMDGLASAVVAAAASISSSKIA
jgi:hypothetical protein